MNHQKQQESNMEDNELSTDYIVKLLERDARSLTRKFSKNNTVGGNDNDGETRHSGTVLRPNTTFLRKIIKESDSHNRDLLNKAREKSMEKLFLQATALKLTRLERHKSERNHSKSPLQHHDHDRRQRDRRGDEPDLFHGNAEKVRSTRLEDRNLLTNAKVQKERRLSLERRRERERDLIRKRKLDLQRKTENFEENLFDNLEKQREQSTLKMAQRPTETTAQTGDINDVFKKIFAKSLQTEPAKRSMLPKDTKRVSRKDNKNQISISYSDSEDDSVGKIRSSKGMIIKGRGVPSQPKQQAGECSEKAQDLFYESGVYTFAKEEQRLRDVREGSVAESLGPGTQEG